MTLRDRVRNASNTVTPAAKQLAEIVRDPTTTKLRKLAAFDELIQFEIGDTALIRARGIERATGISKLYLKYEGDNPTGTQKDRIAFTQVRQALADDKDTVALATCGNYGVAVALAAQLAGLACRIFIPAGYHTEREAEMLKLGAVVERLKGSYEEVVEQSTVLAKAERWADANPGPQNAELQMSAYAQIGREIKEVLPHGIDWCAIPVSNGTLLAGIYQGLTNQTLKKEFVHRKIPKMLAGSSTQKNPIIQSFLAGHATCKDLNPQKINETIVNEPLINWHAFDGDHALTALRKSNGGAVNVSDKNLLATAALVKKTEGYNVLPASTAGLFGLLKMHESQPLEQGVYVAVLTARR